MDIMKGVQVGATVAERVALPGRVSTAFGSEEASRGAVSAGCLSARSINTCERRDEVLAPTGAGDVQGAVRKGVAFGA